MTVRAMTGMTLLDDMLFEPGNERPGRDRIINELVALCTYGETGRPA